MRSVLLILFHILLSHLCSAQVPEIVATSPAPNGFNVAVSSNIEVTFSMSMNASTFNNSSFVVHASSTGYHPGIISYNASTNTVNFDPYLDFKVGETISVTLTMFIESSDGTPLQNGYVWNFITMANAGSGICPIVSYQEMPDWPWSVFASDLNGDSWLDLSTSHMGAPGIAMIYNNQDGSFAPYIAHGPIGDYMEEHIAADLDLDGDLDLTISDRGNNNVYIMLNNGDGTFAPFTSYSTGGKSYTMAVADFNADGFQDIVTNDLHGGGKLSMLYNNGDGTFLPYYGFFATSGEIMALDVADMNSDGSIDIIACILGDQNEDDELAVIFNDGNGLFPTSQSLTIWEHAEDLCVGDFDGDNDNDVALPLLSDYCMLYLNTGLGEVILDSFYMIGSSSIYSICTNDFDGDGDLDLASANSGSVSLLLNNSDATFGEAIIYPIPQDVPISIFSADLDNDDDLDIATAIHIDGYLAILYNQECVYGNAVLAIDRSGSMFFTDPLGQSRLDRAKLLAHDEIDQLLDSYDLMYSGVYQVAIMSFNADGIVLLQDFTSDSEALHYAVDQVTNPRHDTPLAAAMCQSHCLLNQMQAYSKLVFTYTDGLENESQNFEMCSLCEPCSYLMETGWNFDCDPSNPSSCTEWQLCLADQFASTGINIVHYFGEPINPFDKSNEGLEDMYFLKSAAEASSGGFFYHSDQEADGFICGDANRDFDVNISDAAWIINYVFVSGEAPDPMEAGDSNCDSSVNISDAVWIINYVFIGGNDPCDTDGDTVPDC